MIEARNAVLRVKRIRQSRNGAFCIADLTTDFGEFKVKDPLLEQFQEGEYDATVWISEIFLSQYMSYGKAVTEIRARLHDLQVHTGNERPQPSEPAEMDPLDEQPAVRTPPIHSAPEDSAPEPKGKGVKTKDKRWDQFKSKHATAPAAAPEAAADAGKDLFDSELLGAIQRREPVKLDHTIERAVLRLQATFLGDANYRFDALQQTWLPK